MRGLVDGPTKYFRITRRLTAVATAYRFAALALDGAAILEMDTVARSLLIGANGGAHVLSPIGRVMGNIAGGA